MRPEESFIAQPIRSLQTMLRVIAEQDDLQPSVIPDGIYGPNTTTAVSAFQRRYGLPVTGVADQATWDAIVPVYKDALIYVDEAEPLWIVLNPNEVIRRGQRDPNLYLVQAILTALADSYESILRPGFSGVLDLPTSNSLSSFQEMSLLPVTGELDKKTWKYLARHYPMAANLQRRDERD